MEESKKRITFLEILTIVVIILSIIWEKNVQEWFAYNPDKADITRSDLFVIIPLIATLVSVSLFRRFGNKRE